MLFRRDLAFAVGHGASVDWTFAEGRTDRCIEVRTAAVPRETIRGVQALDVPGLVVDMQVLASAPDDELVQMLRPLVDKYATWIDSLDTRRQTETDLGSHDAAAQEAIRQARIALSRMEEGLSVLQSSAQARDAFRFANQSMAWQRVRSEWIKQRRKNQQLALADVDIPTNRSWRAFQLAFLLLNLTGLTQG